MMKFQIFVITSLMAFSGMGFSQTANPTDPTQNSNAQTARKGFWEANLAGGNYLVALSRITSVSRHKYVLDGAVIVDEVTVDTEGQSLARFYFISPVTSAAPESGIANSAGRALDIVNNAATERGSSVQDMVQKNIH